MIRKATGHIPEDHIRNAITAASLLTAQRLDDLPMPILWKRGGITGSCSSGMGYRERRNRIGICRAMGVLDGAGKPCGNRRSESSSP
jgi:hypothetical protein